MKTSKANVKWTKKKCEHRQGEKEYTEWEKVWVPYDSRIKKSEVKNGTRSGMVG
jgi:hypothetical protein